MYATMMVTKLMTIREDPRKKNACSNGILPNIVFTPPQANGRFVGTIFAENEQFFGLTLGMDILAMTMVKHYS